jgi:hypothetical protein
MATWPVSLPTNFLKNSLKEGPPDNIIWQEMDYGPPKTRKRGSAAIETFSGSMYMTTAQVATFYTFFNTTLNSGADEFDGFDHPRTGIDTYDWMFTPSVKYQIKPYGLGYIVDISLDRLP